MTEVLEKKELATYIKSPAVLQDLVSKAVKVCSFIEAIPLTCYLQITKTGDTLTVTATDNNSTMVVSTTNKDIISGDDINIVVNAKLFSALVLKLKAEKVKLSVKGSLLTLICGGSYDIDLITEDDGSSVSIPEFEFDSSVPSILVKKEELRSVLTMSKSCKADMKETPTLYNYYMDSDKVLTTDSFKACKNPVKFFNTPVCLGPDLLELAALVSNAEGVQVQENAQTVKFSSTGVSTNGTFCYELYGRKAIEAELESYPVQDIMETLETMFPYQCGLSRVELVNALDRICLFTEGFDNNSVLMSFSAQQIILSTKRNNTQEEVHFHPEHTASVDAHAEVLVDGNALKLQLNALVEEIVKLKFGNNDAIQIISNNVVQILSGLDDSEEEEMI